MKILLACSAGMSTSLIEESMRKEIEERGLNYTVEAKDSASAKNSIKDYDVILLGPQVRFMKAQFEEIAEGKPVEIIPMQMYGLIKGAEILDLVEKLIK